MSTYRGYMPWKSSLSGYSTKSESGSRYSSRDDVAAADSKATPRFGSLASPTTYRPSYSGGTYRSAKRDLPATPTTTYTSKYSTLPNKDTADKDYLTTKNIISSKYGTSKPSSTDTKPNRFSGSTTSLNSKSKIREPSPVVDRRSTLSVSSIRSRDPSPATYVSRSRDPSPVEARFGNTSNGYSSGYNRLYSRANTNNYGTKYGSRSAGAALSYLTASDASARCISQRTKRDKSSKDSSKENSKEPDSSRGESLSVSVDENSLSTDTTTSATKDSNKMIEVSVTTRATSPNLPNPTASSSYLRSRRMDNAKTIEKTIKRPAIKPVCEDKEVQSDRMDDSMKYSRFTASRIAPWSSYLDAKFNSPGFSRFGSGSGNGSSSKINSTKVEKEKSDTDSDKKSPPKLQESSPSKSTSVSRSSSVKSKLDKTKSLSDSRSSIETKSKTCSKSQTSSSKSKSPEAARTLPPQPPKSESPAKTVSSSTGSFKWTNKDYRKSALNVGPTDRPRKSRTASIESDQEVGIDKTTGTPYRRSPSASSEISCASTTITSTSEDDIKQATKLLSSTSIAQCVVNGDELPKNISRTQSFRTVPQHLQQNDVSHQIDNSPKNDETKSFLIRALGPVTNLFKSKTAQSQLIQSPPPRQDTIYLDDNNSTSISESISQDTESVFPATKTKSNSNIQTDDPNWWINTNTNNDQGDFGNNMKYKLRHIDSGEIAWWMNDDNEDNDDTVADDITLNQSEASEKTEPFEGKYKIRHIESGEKAWWLTNDVSEDTSDAVKNNNQIENNSIEEDASSIVKPKYQIASVQSGERAWWLSDDDDVKEDNTKTDNNRNYKIRHIESGEKAWWMNGSESNDNIDHSQSNKSIAINHANSDDKQWWINNENSNDLPTNKSPIKTDQNPREYKKRHVESGEKAWWMSNYNNDDSECDEVDNLNINAMKNCSLECDNLPLGDRASPEGLEDTTKQRSSPYDQLTNNASGRVKTPKKLFISRHTNIDDILGGSCHLSPVLIDKFESKDFFEEISPAQVRIHDSTAQMPVIHRMQHDRDSWDYQSPPVLYQKNKLDDAALQIYKDGDYGAYLDLESSLAEQAEDIEGLHSSRKNSLVVRTQLSVRVHAIIDKLLTTEGRDLRRALFSLKQIFQEDKDLVHGFVALGGLNCLVRVGSGADQNYQNYILRALGQVMLYVDGMNGVMKHRPTIEWLYTLIASKYRLVVKTALKLLLVFVEYVESNCYLLVNGIHAVDGARGTLPWSNVMKLLKDYDNADTELLIYATSLINKTLSGLSDQDSFYDESDNLEQQGMEGVVQRYMSRPGTDLDLLDQLQLYEAVLKFEDGESEGIRIPDNSVRKTLRYRSSNGNQTESTERRKSRRHSTGNSPMPPPIPPHPKSYSPPIQQIVDEDSSSSANSGELNDVFGISKGSRDGAGVTPGLRRRRERAERQKTFMREQQEAAAAGIRPFDERPDENGHDSFVTTSTVHLQNGKTNGVKPLNGTNVAAPKSGISTNKSDSTNGRDSGYDENDLVNSSSIQTHNGYSRQSPKPNGCSEFESQSNRLNTFYSQLSAKNAFNHSTVSIINNKKSSMNGTVGGKLVNENHLDYGATKSNSFINGNSSIDNVMVNGNSSSSNNRVVSNGNGISSVHGIVNSEGDYNENVNGSSFGKSNISAAESENEDKKLLLQLKRDHTVKDLTQKLSNLPMSPQEEKPNRIGDMSGLISKAKEGLAKSKSKGDISRSPSVDQEIKKHEPKKSENELHREELVKNMSRPLTLCDLDFTDLLTEDDHDDLAPRGLGGSVPPPPPMGMPRIPPPMMNFPPPPVNHMAPMHNHLGQNDQCNGDLNGTIKKNKKTVRAGQTFLERSTRGHAGKTIWDELPEAQIDVQKLEHLFESRAKDLISKNKKTVKLFWKEVREDMLPRHAGKTIWDELPEAQIDVQKLEHLFESRAKDLISKKQQELNKNKEIIVLDHKRSNAINIAMTKLPPPRAIKAAILKMDATVVTREGIDKLLNMLPTDEERGKIQEAQVINPELPLGSAEQFLLTLSSISELAARLKLWAFKLDFENSEKEIAEPLMDLKQGLESLKNNRTFKCILATLRSIGIFLNGTPVKGFQIEYLAKVPEVKDTVHKHSLLHHLCHMVMESSLETTDLYSEIGPITRASKTDFADLAHNISYLETECKASWDRLKLIAKHDCPPQLKQKMVDFLADCAERIIILDIVHRRVINRYRKFLLWLGVPQLRILESRPNEVCRIISEFALEYRTTRERVHQQIEKKANHRERNKTRGKMIIDVAKFRTQEDRADCELRQLLGSPNSSVENIETPNIFTSLRRHRPNNLRSPLLRQTDENFTDLDDDILESLVKTATKAPGPRPTPRERKRTRHADRKSLRRTLKNGLSEEERQHVAAYIKGY